VSVKVGELLFLRQHFLQQLLSHDSYTTHHCLRTTRLAIQLGKVCGLSGFELRCLSIAASLHDLGKVKIPKPILTKPQALTASEWALMQTHPELGHDMIAAQTQKFPTYLAVNSVVKGIRHHHEAFDGSGYPDGLKGVAIPLLSRIIALADSFDAMTSQRPYREPLTAPAAVRILCEEHSYRYDPDLQQRLCRVLSCGYGYSQDACVSGTA